MAKLLQPDHWKVLIPPPTIESLQVEEGLADYSTPVMVAERKKLNGVKSILDPYYKKNADRFTAFMRAVDVYKDLRGKVEANFGAQLVSNAWLKHHEIYSEYGLINPDNNMVFFNAELPGSGISMWNHNTKTLFPGRVMDWRASSLLADSKHAFGDFYGLYKLNRDKWIMGEGTPGTPDYNNGDTTSPAILAKFERVMSALGGATTYNHDAGIAADEDYNNQETMNAKLHLGCAIAGFMTLRRGGSFVAKQYTFFETFTWNLILIYASLFDQFYICKPLSSRPTNSEIYLVGKGFRGFPADLRRILLGRLENFSTRPLIPQRVLTTIWEPLTAVEGFCRDFVDQQCKMIREVVDFYGVYDGNVSGLRKELGPIYARSAAEWLRKYPILPIKPADLLPTDGTVSRHAI